MESQRLDEATISSSGAKVREVAQLISEKPGYTLERRELAYVPEVQGAAGS